jgi:hypothetical protein
VFSADCFEIELLVKLSLARTTAANSGATHSLRAASQIHISACAFNSRPIRLNHRP